jgi:hypothetical protein
MRPLVLVPVLVAALLCGTIVGSLILPFLGLVLHDLILWPLAFGVGALFAAIGAGWVGTLLASDQTRSHLLAVVGGSEAIAAVVTVIGFFLGGFYSPAWRMPGFGVSVPVRFGLGMVIIALAASWATGHFRSRGRRLGQDAITTVGLVVVSLLAVIGTLLVASIFGLAGP